MAPATYRSVIEGLAEGGVTNWGDIEDVVKSTTIEPVKRRKREEGRGGRGGRGGSDEGQVGDVCKRDR